MRWACDCLLNLVALAEKMVAKCLEPCCINEMSLVVTVSQCQTGLILKCKISSRFWSLVMWLSVFNRHWACCFGTNTTLKNLWQISPTSPLFQMSGQLKTRCCLNRVSAFMERRFTASSRWWVRLLKPLSTLNITCNCEKEHLRVLKWQPIIRSLRNPAHYWTVTGAYKDQMGSVKSWI